MRYLVHDQDGANHYIVLAWAKVINSLGHEVVLWDERMKSTYDIFYEFNPDVFIGATWKLNKGIIDNLIKRPNMKIILRAPHWGSNDVNIDKNLYPIQFAGDEEKELTAQLKKNHDGFQYVVCQYKQERMDELKTHDLWTNLGLEPKGILLCADIFDYHLTQPSNSYKCDIAWAGSYWPYKGIYLSQYMLPLCYPNTELNVKIFGGGWSTPSCLGIASEETLRNFYASAAICPNVFEPHSVSILADINQRAYQVPACGGFQICQKVLGIEDIFNDNEIVLAEDAKDFFEKVLYYLKNIEERKPYIKAGCLRVYKDHTGHHRTSELLNLLDFNEDSEKCLKIAKENYEKVEGLL